MIMIKINTFIHLLDVIHASPIQNSLPYTINVSRTDRKQKLIPACSWELDTLSIYERQHNNASAADRTEGRCC